MADLNDEVNAVTANLSRLSSEFDRYSRLTAGAADSSKELTTAQRAAAAASRSASDSLYSLRKASGSLGSSLYEGRRGMEAFTTATAATAEAATKLMDALGKGLGVLGGSVFSKVLSGLGAVSGATLKVAATLYDLASNMADRQYDAYSKLTDTGAIASEGMTGIGDAANKLGLNILKLDEYVSLVNENSKELALFGKSAFDGRRKFELLGQSLAGERENLFKLGMTQEQVNESMMGYIRLQNLAGKGQTAVTAELTDSTRKYLYEQDALSKLLGMSRKEQQSAREAALSEQRFGAKIAAMRASGDAQQIAAAEQLEQQNLVLAKVSPELAQGFRDLTTGMITTEAAQKANTSTQGQILKDVNDVISGVKTGGEGAYSSLQALATTAKKFNMSYQMGTGENFLVKFAETQQARQFLEKDFNTEMRKILDERANLLNTAGKKDDEIKGDKRLIDYAKLLKDNQQIMLTLQSVVNHGLEITFKGEKINLSADTVVGMQTEISDGIIKFLKNNEYFKLDVRDTGKSPANQIVSADTDLKNAKADAKVAKEAEARAIKNLEDKKEKVSIIEEAVKAGRTSQAQLDAEKKKAEEAATSVKTAIAARETAEKRLAEAEKRYEEVKKNIKPVVTTPVVTTPPPPPPPPAGETEDAKQTRIQKETEAAKKAADEAAAAKKATEENTKKSQAKEPAKISRLDSGARVLEDVLELANKGIPIISNVRTQEEQDKLKDHKDDKGRWFTKDNLPVAEDTKHLTGDAIDVDTTKMTKEFVKILQDSGWKQPLPKDDPGHWERVPKSKAKKTSDPVAPKVQTDIAPLTAEQVAANTKNMPTMSDLIVNSDVATLNSKGMNITLDNFADVTKMLTETVTAKVDIEKPDQTTARTSFENSMGDVKTALSNQKDTNEMLLAAIQELIRVQKTGVDWQQKTYQATA